MLRKPIKDYAASRLIHNFAAVQKLTYIVKLNVREVAASINLLLVIISLIILQDAGRW